MLADEIAALDATAQADLVRRHEVSAPELVDAAIARIERGNPTVNAVIIDRFEEARKEASALDGGAVDRGPFAGVPFLVKDLGCALAGSPHHMGMAFLRDLAWVEQEDSALARRFKRAGLVILGRTNTPELGAGMTTEPEAYGSTCNPWDPSRSAGGSSGGSAAAVASGMVPAAHGNDGGGSLRIPASECGLVGFKVNRGRVRSGGDGWADLGLGVEGVLTRTVRDTAALLDAMGPPPGGTSWLAPPLPGALADEVGRDPRRLRIGFATAVGSQAAPTHPECEAAVRGAAALLEGLGHSVEESHPAGLDDPSLTVWYSAVYTSGLPARIEKWGERIGRSVPDDALEPSTRMLAGLGRAQSAVDLLRALAWVQSFTVTLARWWSEDGFDVLVTPTLAMLPPALGEVVTPDNPMVGMARGAAVAAFTPVFNATGQPAVSLPLHWSDDGLPVGVQFVAAHGREDLLIRLAAQLEEAVRWADRWPPRNSSTEMLRRHRGAGGAGRSQRPAHR